MSEDSRVAMTAGERSPLMTTRITTNAKTNAETDQGRKRHQRWKIRLPGGIHFLFKALEKEHARREQEEFHPEPARGKLSVQGAADVVKHDEPTVDEFP